jgi:hypothetical protein
LFIIVAGVCALAGPARVFAATTGDQRPQQPDLQAIVDALKETKTETDPGPALDRASKLLDKQLKKGGTSQKDMDAHADLEKAQKAVGEAKAAVTAKDTQLVGEKVDHAISEVKMAIEAKERKGN